jgi:ribose transport system permease protein
MAVTSAVGNPRRSRLIGLFALGEAGVIAALITLALVFWMLEPAFLSERNVRAMLNVVSFIGIIAIGQTILLINGEFDLSVGSVAGLAAVASGKFMTASGWPVPIAVLGGLFCGATMGLVNGLAVVKLRIPAFIQTLGMLFIGQGLIQIVTGGYPIYPMPEAVGAFAQRSVIAGLGWSFIFFLVAAVIGDVLLRHSVVGRNMYAVGGNVRVADLVGIPTGGYKIGAFVATGALSAIAGMLVMADLASATTGIGSGWELTVIAGVVVGGVSLFGGTGTIVGGLMGVLLLQVVQSGLVTVGVSANWQQIAVGLIMIVAVGLDTLRRRLAVEGLHFDPAGSSASRPTADACESGTPRVRERSTPAAARLKLKIVLSVLVILAAIATLALTTRLRSASESSSAAAAVAGATRSHSTSIPGKRLLWVQPLRDHPVCRLMQAGFLHRCQELGHICEVVGNASATNLDVAATIPLAEAALAREQFDAVGVFTLDTSIYRFVAELAAEGLPVVSWHELSPEGSIKGLKAVTGEDLSQVGREAALALGEKLGGQGAIAVTQGSFNVEENAKAVAFRKAMADHFPNIRVLNPQLEGFEATAAKARAIGLLQGNVAITGIFSTTGNGAQTWAGAARAASRKIIIIGMDYIRANLDLVRSGEVYAIVAQPLYEEGAKTAELLAALSRGERVPYRNPLPAKVITAADVAPYYQLLEKAGQ